MEGHWLKWRNHFTGLCVSLHAGDESGLRVKSFSRFQKYLIYPSQPLSFKPVLRGHPRERHNVHLIQGVRLKKVPIENVILCQIPFQ